MDVSLECAVPGAAPAYAGAGGAGVGSAPGGGAPDVGGGLAGAAVVVLPMLWVLL